MVHAGCPSYQKPRPRAAAGPKVPGSTKWKGQPAEWPRSAHDVVEAAHGVDFLAEVDVLGFEARLELADLNQARRSSAARSR